MRALRATTPGKPNTSRITRLCSTRALPRPSPSSSAAGSRGACLVLSHVEHPRGPRRLWLSDAFEFLTSGEQFRQSKPNPEIYLYTLELLGLPADVCCCIEDSVPGIAAGKAAGLTVFGQARGSLWVFAGEPIGLSTRSRTCSTYARLDNTGEELYGAMRPSPSARRVIEWGRTCKKGET